MSSEPQVRRAYVVDCVGCGRRELYVETARHAVGTEAVDHLRRQGWRKRKGGTLCPSCAEGGSAGTR